MAKVKYYAKENSTIGTHSLNITSGSAPEVPVQAVGPPTIGNHPQGWFSSFYQEFENWRIIWKS